MERDTARESADQLADVLQGAWGYMQSAGLEYAAKEPIEEMLDAYGARDWRPISPPGSGVDGLMADINREKP
jgi:hypothetical protein